MSYTDSSKQPNSHSPEMLDKVGKLLFEAIKKTEDSLYMGKDAYAYQEHLGDFRRNYTLASGDTPPIPKASIVDPNMLPDYAALIGLIHNAFRIKLPRLLQIKLDESSLSGNTLAKLKQLDDLSLRHENRIKELQILNPAWELSRKKGDEVFVKNDLELQSIRLESEKVCDALKCSELATAPAIAIGIGDQKKIFPNDDQLGLYIALFSIATKHLLDHSKAPKPIIKLVSEAVGTDIKILENMIRKFSAPELREQLEIACGECMVQVKKEMESRGHGLQIVNLFMAPMPNKPAQEILSMFDLPAYPDRLENNQECIFTIQAVVRGGGPIWQQYCQPLISQLKENAPITDDSVADANQAMNYFLSKYSGPDAKVTAHQIKLIQNYLGTIREKGGASQAKKTGMNL